MISKYLSYVVLVLILIFGIFKLWVLSLISPAIKAVLELVGVDTDSLISWLHSITANVHSGDYILGWVAYYPIYFLLHLTFISILYRHNKKIKYYLIALLSGVILLLIAGIVIFRFLELTYLANVFLAFFRNLFGLPFILLAIEGGRILYNDIVKLSNKPPNLDEN
ncbi:MAG: hypothetical protein WBA74_27150 [Cyclobacteriaceae bacterium]